MKTFEVDFSLIKVNRSQNLDLVQEQAKNVLGVYIPLKTAFKK